MVLRQGSGVSVVFLRKSGTVLLMQKVSMKNSIYIYNFMGGIPEGVFGVPEL